MTQYTYVCAACGDTKTMGWSDEEAKKEYLDNFGEEPTQETADIVCDDCYNRIMSVLKPGRN
jgi:DNA-directed RNA polymerase subunit RPC12/RpoP